LATASAAIAQPQGGGGGLSPEVHASREAVRQACAADLKSLCDGKEGREVMMCLRDNAAKLSAPCQDALSKMPARPPRQ
ncbi:MAG: hypothetical protein JWO33_1387, partial [Caulobacteraceae bacterium]|nr:hypothetical protein [Caulobacteraceae bacterium]